MENLDAWHFVKKASQALDTALAQFSYGEPEVRANINLAEVAEQYINLAKFVQENDIPTHKEE